MANNIKPPDTSLVAPITTSFIFILNIWTKDPCDCSPSWSHWPTNPIPLHLRSCLNGPDQSRHAGLGAKFSRQIHIPL